MPFNEVLHPEWITGKDVLHLQNGLHIRMDIVVDLQRKSRFSPDMVSKSMDLDKCCFAFPICRLMTVRLLPKCIHSFYIVNNWLPAYHSDKTAGEGHQVLGTVSGGITMYYKH